MEEETAYHEAGHVLVAIELGGRIESVTLLPEQDDCALRYGEVKISWPGEDTVTGELSDKALLAALAGPVAEMIITGEKRHPGFVPEWKHDWDVAWQAAAFRIPNERRRLAYLEQITQQLHRRFSDDLRWQQIALIVDHLLAYETLEDEEVREILGMES